MCLRIIFHFGISLYKVYDDRLFDGFLNNTADGDPSMSRYGYRLFPMATAQYFYSRSGYL
jgi:hypothetical protein